jgi:hypothetical protein
MDWACCDGGVLFPGLLAIQMPPMMGNKRQMLSIWWGTSEIGGQMDASLKGSEFLFCRKMEIMREV